MKSKKNLKFMIAVAAVLAIGLALTAFAQAPVMVRRAELAIPFGTASGKLVAVSDQLVFVDDDQPEASFSIARGEIRDLKTEGDVVMIGTHHAIRDRSGERSQFNFRLRDGSTEPLMMWAGAKTTAAQTTASTMPTTSGQEQWIYNARHKHAFGVGSCTGKLIITKDRVTYESLEDRDHTRQWPFNDIKKIKRDSPYQIEVETFNRGGYTLELEGQGMDISVHKQLTDWIAKARSR